MIFFKKGKMAAEIPNNSTVLTKGSTNLPIK